MACSSYHIYKINRKLANVLETDSSLSNKEFNICFTAHRLACNTCCNCWSWKQARIEADFLSLLPPHISVITTESLLLFPFLLSTTFFLSLICMWFHPSNSNLGNSAAKSHNLSTQVNYVWYSISKFLRDKISFVDLGSVFLPQQPIIRISWTEKLMVKITSNAVAIRKRQGKKKKTNISNTPDTPEFTQI